MLRNLHIKHLALIEEVDVDFREGLNILTGETGAGKSIIIDSISLALGSRVRRDMVRPGDTGLVELVFEITSPAVAEKLREMDIEPEEGIVLIARKISDGRSTLRINGETRTVSDVRSCASLLLDIHGQSEHQKLLHPETQLSLIDEYGGEPLAKAKKAVRDSYHIWRELKTALDTEELSEEERARRMSFLTFEISEIDEASLSPGEDEETERTYRKLANAMKIAETVEKVHSLTGYDSPECAGDLIGTAIRKLEAVSGFDQELDDFLNQLSEIDSLLNDFNRSVSDYADNLTYEADSLKQTEERLNTLNHLKAKYGGSIDKVLAERDEKARELEDLTDYERRRASLIKKLEDEEAVLKKASGQLSSLRQKSAAAFSKAVTGQLLGLNFASVDFAVSFRALTAFTANGADAVEYMISTNPGAGRNVLSHVVSGGELSRIMLGIRTMFADSDVTDTLIFDEIDTGISGRTAQKVAERLADVSRRHQVLCITHLPQIAAMADAHYGITKSLSDSSAITEIEALDERESADELARMLGGAEITENTRNSAREMKEMCRQYKADVL